MDHTNTGQVRPAESGKGVFWAAGAIAVAAVAAYHNCFHVPFVFDDLGTIVRNKTIRHLWPIWTALSPPEEGMPVTGRPIANLSFAVNYALGGLNVWGYHATNLLIHICAGWTLFGIMRRTLRRGQVSTRDVASRDVTSRDLTPSRTPQVARASSPWDQNTGWKPVPLFLAFAIALIWTLHPLQTESVTYISQRVESLMGLFYLLTIYGFIRYADEKAEVEKRKAETAMRSSFPLSAFRFPLLSVAACLLGMATKEVMATAPVVVFLYDRTFVSGSFREAWRLRKGYYLALACCWIPLAFLLAGTGDRGGTAGFQAAISWPDYAITQFRAIAHYLRLSFWPSPLVFYYGSAVGAPPGELAVDIAVVVGLLAGSLYLLFRPVRKEPGVDGREVLLRPAGRGFGGQALGFAGACFFLILAPSSSVVPVATETIAEHRMYLPLAAVIAVVVCGAAALLDKEGPARRSSVPRNVVGALVVALAIACAFLTAHRNEDYRSDLVLWQTTADHYPSNEITQYNLGMMLARAGRTSEAIEHYREALRLKPDYTEAQNNLGRTLADAGQWTEAIALYEEAMQREPDLATIRFNLGDALLHAGRLDEAIASYEACVRLDPDRPDAYDNLGTALVSAGRAPEALPYFQDALRLVPDSPEVINNYGTALVRVGLLPEAISQFQKAVRLQPDYVEAHDNLGTALAQSGRVAEAAGEFAAASRLQPDNPEIHNNLGCALAQLGRYAEARREFEQALRLKPDDAGVRSNLDRLPQPQQGP